MKIKNFYDLGWEYNQMLLALQYEVTDYSNCDLLRQDFRLNYNSSKINKLRYYLSPNFTVADEKDENIIHD